MTSKISDRRKRISDAAWLSPHRKAFIEDLSADAYSPEVIGLYERMIDSFCAVVADRGLGSKDMQGPPFSVPSVGDRVLFLSHGKILLAGDPKRLPQEHGKNTLEELFITVAREPLTLGGR